jgi:DNA-binding MarR family transcriptional regulator
MSEKMDPIAEMICELTRNCTIKEEYFAASFNLTPTEVRLLKLFSFSSKYTIKELRDLLKLTPGRITHILTTLEEKKLITRVQDLNDKRIILVNLTAKALPLINNLHQNYNDLHKRILQSVDASELEKIASSLEILNDVFKKWVDQK